MTNESHYHQATCVDLGHIELKILVSLPFFPKFYQTMLFFLYLSRKFGGFSVFLLCPSRKGTYEAVAVGYCEL